MTDIPLDDRGFTLGHGLFETVLWADGVLAHWEAHVERLDRGCRALRLPLPERAVVRAAAESALVAAETPKRAAVRLNWSAGSGDRGLDPPSDPRPRLTASAAALGPPPGPARLITAHVRRNDRSPASRLKTLSYLDNVIARAEARDAGADEALMLNTAGEVACAAAANVFWVRHEEVFTPDLDCGVLDGIMRREVIAACHALGVPVQEVYANLGRVAGAPMFITNSLAGVRPVANLDGRELPGSPLITAIAKAISRAPK
ncbi:MAG: aminotransferase class IV [Alphaproteobacteria bacterium]|nr:aminotransferase class IV [Alphaproteobacteria bacterium]MBU1514431.1 aminotransferase class IV [Alphaproteobacteria bacterium]MBU2097088.1 aminotransferase class IV [Alphaproteobacteria bacterium]MBU2153567.1 aminotransferase class IV [Alphaproteobacteria bacterium]MBU2308630.1 aminotransferase class IV [Alphaproteobacteria bacterium]